MNPTAKHRKPRSRLSFRPIAILTIPLLAFGPAASASPWPTEQPVIISPDGHGIPFSVFEYRLTDHYWKAFRACRVEQSDHRRYSHFRRDRPAAVRGGVRCHRLGCRPPDRRPAVSRLRTTWRRLVDQVAWLAVYLRLRRLP